MTNFTKTTQLFAALALTFSTAAPTLVAAQNSIAFDKGTTFMRPANVAVNTDVRSMRLATIPASQAADDGNSTFCGNADTIVIYDEDANGDPVAGSEEYSCTD